MEGKRFSEVSTVHLVITVKNQDLEFAKLKLIQEDLSLVIVKKGKVVFETKKQGISGFLQAIEKLDKKLVASSVADRIVGVAAAMLCVYAGVASVFALTVSEGGIRVLEENNVACRFEKKVSNILNRSKSDVCPFEKLAVASGSPDEAYVKLKSLASEMVKKSEKTDCG
jgi:UDP-3-O-acyl-N-acetylglucosamine deacetylase